MKKLLIIAFLSVLSLGFASAGLIDDNKSTIEIQKNIKTTLLTNELSNLTKDCTVRLDFELSDGSTIQGEITFVDVTWWQCTKMQVAAWWERNF